VVETTPDTELIVHQNHQDYDKIQQNLTKLEDSQDDNQQ
jgi:hypothetical protein